MEIVYDLLVTVHLFGMATILCGVVAQHVARRGLVLAVSGAAIQVLSGLALVGIASAKLVDKDVDNTKIAVKLVIALVVLVLTFLLWRKKNSNVSLLHTAATLTMANVVIAAMW